MRTARRDAATREKRECSERRDAEEEWNIVGYKNGFKEKDDKEGRDDVATGKVPPCHQGRMRL